MHMHMDSSLIKERERTSTKTYVCSLPGLRDNLRAVKMFWLPNSMHIHLEFMEKDVKKHINLGGVREKLYKQDKAERAAMENYTYNFFLDGVHMCFKQESRKRGWGG